MHDGHGHPLGGRARTVDRDHGERHRLIAWEGYGGHQRARPQLDPVGDLQEWAIWHPILLGCCAVDPQQPLPALASPSLPTAHAGGRWQAALMVATPAHSPA